MVTLRGRWNRTGLGMVATVERRWTVRGTHTPAKGHQEQGDSLTPRTCGYSSDGRAAAFQAAGRRFDPGYPLGVSGAAGLASHNAPPGEFRVKASRAHAHPAIFSGSSMAEPPTVNRAVPGSSPGRRAPPLRWLNAADSSVAQWIKSDGVLCRASQVRVLVGEQGDPGGSAPPHAPVHRRGYGVTANGMWSSW